MYYPFWTQTNLQTISNLLCSVEASNELSRISQPKGAFQLVQIRPVRSTSLMDVHFVGADSNSVERVASNACVIVQRFFSTNQPPVQVEFVEAGPSYLPKPWWRRIISSLNEMF
jgi:hypothetical protein